MERAPKDEEQEREYILGTQADELARLRFQHFVWTESTQRLLRTAALRAGNAVLDLGCGPGLITLELAQWVGPTGRVVAVDRSARFLRQLEASAARAGFAQIETRCAEAEQLELEPESLDAVYERWFLCWPQDPAPVLQRVVRALRPGGCVLMHDYLDWAAMKLLPGSRAFDRGVEACMASWRLGGGTMNIGDRVPELAAACDLTIERFEATARVGGVGSLEWRWLDEFFTTYLPKVVEQGLLGPEELRAFLVDWKARTEAGTSYCTTPTVFQAVLRKG